MKTLYRGQRNTQMSCINYRKINEKIPVLKTVIELPSQTQNPVVLSYIIQLRQYQIGFELTRRSAITNCTNEDL